VGLRGSVLFRLFGVFILTVFGMTASQANFPHVALDYFSDGPYADAKLKAYFSKGFSLLSKLPHLDSSSFQIFFQTHAPDLLPQVV